MYSLSTKLLEYILQRTFARGQSLITHTTTQKTLKEALRGSFIKKKEIFQMKNLLLSI